MPDDSNRVHECGRCIVADRRGFLGGLALALTALAVEGILPRAAHALPMVEVQPIAAAGEEATYAIPATDGVQFDKGKEVILARHAGAVYAFSLSCPHQNTALRWNAGSAQFQCPRHKSKYQPDGTFISGRATRAMDRYAVRKDGERVVVSLDSLFEQDADAVAWGAAKVAI